MDGVRRIGPQTTAGDAGEARVPKRPAASGQATSQQVNPGLANAPERPEGAGTGLQAKFAAPGGSPAPGDAVEPQQTTNVRPLASKRLVPMGSIIRRELTDGGNDVAALTERFDDLLTEIDARSGRMADPMQRASAMAALAENLQMLSNIDGAKPATNPRFQVYLRLGNMVAQQSRETADPERATKAEREAFTRAMSQWSQAREHLRPGERAAIAIGELSQMDPADFTQVKHTVRDILEAVETHSDLLALLGPRLHAVLNIAEYLGSADSAQAESWPSFRDETLQHLDNLLERELQTVTDDQDRNVVRIISARVTEIRTAIKDRGQTNGAPVGD